MSETEAKFKVIGNTGVGSFISFLMILLNFLFVCMLLTSDLECHKTLVDSEGNKVCNEIWNYGIKGVDNDYDHHAARFGYLIVLTTVLGYLVFMYAQILKWSGQKSADGIRAFQLPIAVYIWIAHLTCLITFQMALVSGRKEAATHTPTGGHDELGVDYETAMGMHFVIVTFVFSTFVTIRYAILRFMPGSGAAQYVKGEFGAGVRVAEQFPIMGA